MGATCAMFVLGSLREIIGNGTLFDGADALLGSWAKVLRVEIFHTDSLSCWRCCHQVHLLAWD
ncbi:hypothetical protein MUTS16_46490 [Escherichia coli]|nr:hypothetical protein MUTS16_46490 [Escherichia coli]